MAIASKKTRIERIVSGTREAKKGTFAQTRTATIARQNAPKKVESGAEGATRTDRKVQADQLARDAEKEKARRDKKKKT